MYSKIAFSARRRISLNRRQISLALVAARQGIAQQRPEKGKNVSTAALSYHLSLPLIETWKPCWRKIFR